MTTETKTTEMSFDEFQRLAGHGGAKGSGPWACFVRSLELEQPVRLPTELQERSKYASSALRHAMKSGGLPGHIATRTFGGNTWVCLLADEPSA